MPRALPPDGVPARLAGYLRWLIAIRLVVITSVVLPYLLVQLSSPEGQPPSFDLLYLIAGSTYVASLVYIALLSVLRRHPTWHAYLQFGGDLLLVTSLVYFFGGIGSPFSMLYLVVIMVASVLLRHRAGLLVATGAYLLYASLLIALARGWLPQGVVKLSEAEVAWRLPYNLAVHFFGFYVVALLTSYLADNVTRAERELEEKRDSLANLEVFHRDVVQSISSGLIAADLGGRITSVNRAALDILGRGEAELLSQSILACGLFDAAGWSHHAARAAGSRAARTEVEVARGAGSIPVGFNVSRLTDTAGTTSGWIVVFQDLSQWRLLQEELRMKDRMAAVGELAAGLAHEIGNPLAAISGSVQLLSAALPADDKQRRLLDIILKESQRLDRTIKGFLRFARPKERAVTRFDVAALLAENMALLRHSEEATGRHRFELDLDPPSAAMVADADQVSQIFWNLARNALRAMPDGGTLTLTGRVVGEAYRIGVRDTGRGMTEEQRTKLFQPFQSFFDGGTGIGMAIVYRIVQEHAGRLAVDSRPGQGSTIVVELPLAHSASAVVAMEA
jgi:two-component system sensor histidine kinase PilS (NtrC family)